jgi:hypothetical protein
MLAVAVSVMTLVVMLTLALALLLRLEQFVQGDNCFTHQQWTVSRSGICSPEGALPTSGSRSPETLQSCSLN